MFSVGDIVEINAKNNAYAMPDSPALNLKGTLAEIISINELSSTYNLKFIDVKTVKPELFEEAQANLAWKDRNLILVKAYDGIDELDTSVLFMH